MANQKLINDVGKYIDKYYVPGNDDIIMDKEMESIFDKITLLRQKRAESLAECEEEDEIAECEEIVDEDYEDEEFESDECDEILYFEEDCVESVDFVDEEIEVEEDYEIDDDAIEEFDESEIKKVKFTSPMSKAMPMNRRIEDLMGQLEETFSQRLLRMITERGMTDAEAYNKAYVDRRHFSKIRNDVNYVPNKKTVLAFAIALELSMDEAKDLLNCAGFALSRSSKTDIIVAYFLQNKIYDMFEINDVLDAYDQPVFV